MKSILAIPGTTEPTPWNTLTQWGQIEYGLIWPDKGMIILQCVEQYGYAFYHRTEKELLDDCNLFMNTFALFRITKRH